MSWALLLRLYSCRAACVSWRRTTCRGQCLSLPLQLNRFDSTLDSLRASGSGFRSIAFTLLVYFMHSRRCHHSHSLHSHSHCHKFTSGGRINRETLRSIPIQCIPRETAELQLETRLCSTSNVVRMNTLLSSVHNLLRLLYSTVIPSGQSPRVSPQTTVSAPPRTATRVRKQVPHFRFNRPERGFFGVSGRAIDSQVARAQTSGERDAL